MTKTKKQILPALHKSNKVQNPDMPSVEQQNYTSTVLKYANLALPFPQLETDAKRVVPAINELYENRAIANPEEPADQDPLNTVQIAGTVYKIEGGGGDYTAGAGIYFTGNNNSVINADAGRFSPAYTYQGWSAEYTGDYQGYWRPGWEDSGTTEEGHTVYQSAAGTYMMSSGNSICTYRVGGYGQYTIYVKQNPETSGFRYAIFGYQNSEIDFDTEHYAYSCQDRSDSDYISRTYYSEGESFVQVMYHKEPMTQGVTLDLKDGQWVDTGTTVDGHTVYKSDAGSWHINNGSSICTLKIAGITSFTIYFRSSSESSYDWAYVGNLDTDVSRYSYKSRLSGENSYTAVTFECSSGEHMVQVMYAKDSSVNSYDDRGYFYYVINEYAPIPPDDDRAYTYIEVSNPISPRGEIFNDYERNIALGDNAHAEGYGAKAYGTASHAEGFSNKANSSYAHVEGIDNIAYGSASHVEGGQNQTLSEKSHAEGMDNVAGGAYSHVEGAYNKAMGERSHAEGYSTLAQGHNSHAEGRETQALGWRSHSEGNNTIAEGESAHAEGWASYAKGSDSHAEGYYATTYASQSHAEGYYTVTRNGSGTHAEGYYSEATQTAAHAEGEYTVASGEASHAEGYGDSNTKVISSGKGSHAEGGYTSATADFAHAEGRFTIASGLGAHAEGYGGYGGQYNTATGIASHAEGSGNLVSGNCGHAEGTRNTVYGESGHADGSGNKVYGRESHATGSGNIVSEQSGYIEGAGNRNIAYSAHVEGAGNKNTYKANISHTEGAGNTNYGHQTHLEGSGNQLSGEESHLEGAGNMLHGHKSHMEGGGNTAYAFGSHIEGKHNTAVGYGHHAEGINNHVGFNGTPGYFSYGTTYEVGDIVGVNTAYFGSFATYPETDTHYLYRCITAPGQIQQSSTVNIVTPDIWDSTVTYQSGAVVQLSDIGFYYNSSSESVTGTMPTAGWPWNRIYDVLSPFQTSGSGYYMLDCDEVYGANKIAVVYDTIQPMWEPLPNTSGGHIEGVGNIAIGDYQHVQGKYNTADANKAFIIGNGTDEDHRSNALTVDWSGNTTIAGDLTTGTTLNTTSQTIGAAINEISVRVPAPPTSDGHYTLSLTITNGVPTYSWVPS